MSTRHFLIGLEYTSENWYDPTAAVLSIDTVRARQLIMAQAAVHGEPRPGVFLKTEILKLCVLASYQVHVVDFNSSELGGGAKRFRLQVEEMASRLEVSPEKWLQLKPREVTALNAIRVDRVDGGEYIIYDDKIVAVVEDRDNSSMYVETVDIMPILKLLTKGKK